MQSKVENFKNKYSKDYIKNLYITRNLSKEEICTKLNITNNSLNNLLKEYDIIKPADLVAKKRRETSLQRYGFTNPSKSPVIIEKIKNTNIERYGKPAFAATEDGIRKGKDTKLKKYGSSNYNNIDKNKATKLERYGDANYCNVNKIRETCLERYGVDNYFKTITIKELHREQVEENYSDIFKEIYNDRNKAIDFLSTNAYTYFDLAKIFNVSYNTIQQWSTRNDLQNYIDFSFTADSSYEKDIKEFLVSLNINNIIAHYKMSNKQEIDIFLPDLNIGIEFNGTYWHSSLFKDKKYHFNKSLQAEKENIKLIHIYQYEWDDVNIREKLKSLLTIAVGKTLSKIYARDCEIRKITNNEAKPFNDKNHLQGHRNAQVTYGLFYNNELVQLMSFSKTRYNKNLKEENSWEIVRGCPGSNNIVVGGVSKLFTHFLRDYNPDKVFSYCDFNKFDGRGYEAIGMKFIGYTGPDMKWILSFAPASIVNRDPQHHKELKEKATASIYGAGSKKYIYVSDRV